MRKAVKKRIKLTATGKLLRRAAAATHSKTRKSNNNLLRKKRMRGIGHPAKKVIAY